MAAAARLSPPRRHLHLHALLHRRRPAADRLDAQIDPFGDGRGELLPRGLQYVVHHVRFALERRARHAVDRRRVGVVPAVLLPPAAHRVEVQPAPRHVVVAQRVVRRVVPHDGHVAGVEGDVVRVGQQVAAPRPAGVIHQPRHAAVVQEHGERGHSGRHRHQEALVGPVVSAQDRVSLRPEHGLQLGEADLGHDVVRQRVVEVYEPAVVAVQQPPIRVGVAPYHRGLVPHVEHPPRLRLDVSVRIEVPVSLTCPPRARPPCARPAPRARRYSMW